VAPAEHALALFLDHVLDHLLAGDALERIGREEHLADREPAAGRELVAEARDLAAQEPIGKLDQDAGAVTGLRIRAARRAVAQAAEHLEAVVDDRPALRAVDVRYEPDATRVSLEARIMQAGQRYSHRVPP